VENINGRFTRFFFAVKTLCSRIIIMKGQIRKIVFSCMQHLIEPAFDRATVFA